jgi:hypothetical protein
MTFLNPLVLLGLVTAAIPVLLHLLNLRKLRTIEFSTLTFLKELQQTKIRRLKVRQLLLLLLRMLLIVFLVLAFARPALRGSLFGTIGANARTTYVIILDDSYSMSVADERGERFKQAQQACETLIDFVEEGDEVFLLKLSDVPNATTEAATHDVSALRNLIREAQPSAVRRTLNDALKLAAKLLASSSNANKEVYLISDIQKTLVEIENVPPRQSSTQYFDERTRFFVLNIGDENVLDNVGIDSVRILTTIVEQNKPVVIEARINNYGKSVLENYVTSVSLDGVKAAQQGIHLEPWSSSTVTFTIPLKRAGILKGYVELENDALEADNKRYFTVAVPEQITTVVVSDNELDHQYVMLAMNPGGSTEKPLIAVERVTWNQVSSIDMKRVDVMVLFGDKNLSSGLRERLKGFVERGGGLLLFPNSSGETAESLLPELSIPSVEGMFNAAGTAGGLTFGKTDFDHPIFSSVFEPQVHSGQRTMDIESPAIIKTLQRTAGQRGHIIISLNNGQPFLSEHLLGEGKVLFFSVAPVFSWSDFPMKGIFVPLIYRSVMYVSSKDKTTSSFIAGEHAMLSLPPHIFQAGTYSLIFPDGVEEFVRPVSTIQGSTLLQLPLLTVTGIYDVRVGSQTLTSFAVNLDGKESDGRKISDEEFEQVWTRMGVSTHAVKNISQIDRLHDTVLETRFGVEFWKYCVGIALLLALVEMLVARDSRKELDVLAAKGTAS